MLRSPQQLSFDTQTVACLHRYILHMRAGSKNLETHLASTHFRVCDHAGMCSRILQSGFLQTSQPREDGHQSTHRQPAILTDISGVAVVAALGLCHKKPKKPVNNAPTSVLQLPSLRKVFLELTMYEYENGLRARINNQLRLEGVEHLAFLGAVPVRAC